MAGDKPQMGEGATGWISTPYYQQVQASQSSQTSQPSQAPAMAGAMINPKTGEFLYQGSPSYKYYEEPESGSVVEIFHGGKLEPSLPVTYYNAQGQITRIQPAYANVVEEGKPFFSVGPDWEQVEIHGGKIEAVNQLTPETPTTSTISGGTAKLLGGGEVSYVGQAPFGSTPTSLITTVSTSEGSTTTTQPIPSRIVENALPLGGEYGVYDASGKLLSGESYQYSKNNFFGTPSEPNIPSSWKFSTEQIKNVAYNPDTGQYISYANSIPKGFISVTGTSGLWTAPQTTVQVPKLTAEQQFDIEHPGYWENMTAAPSSDQYSTANIVANSLEGLTGAPPSSVLGQMFQLYGQGVQATETAAKTLINVGTPLGQMAKASEVTGRFTHLPSWDDYTSTVLYQPEYLISHPSDVLTTVGVGAVIAGGVEAIPMEILGGEISAGAQEGIKTLFTPGYNPATANQWQSEFLGGVGSAAVAGQVYNLLRPELVSQPSSNILSQLTKTGDIALATEGSAFAGGVTYAGISSSLQGKQASTSELATAGAEAMILAFPFAGVSLRMETQAQQAYLEQLQEQATNPQALFEVSTKLVGTVEGGVKVTEATEFQVPGLVDEDYVNKLMELQTEQGVPVKNIEVSAGGAGVTYQSGMFFPSEENPFVGTLKAGTVEINPPTVNLPTFYGEEPTLPEMMTSGYVPTDVSANFEMQYKVPYTGPLPISEVSVPKVDVSAAYQFFNIQPEINPFEEISNIEFMTPEAAARLSDIVAWRNAPEVPEMAGVKQIFGTDWRTAGNEIIPLPEETGPSWEYDISRIGSQEIPWMKVPEAKIPYFEVSEGAVVSPESFQGIMLGVPKVEFNLPSGTPSWNIGDLGIETVSFKAPPEINLQLTEGDKSLIRGMQQQNLLEEMTNTGELPEGSTMNDMNSMVQQTFEKMQEQGQVVLSVKQVETPMSADATAQAFGISPQLFPYTVPQESEVPATLPTPASVYERSTLQSGTISDMFTQVVPLPKIAELPSVNIKQMEFTSSILGQKSASDISDRFMPSLKAAQSELPKFEDVFKVSQLESQDVLQKQMEQQSTITSTITSQISPPQIPTFTMPPPPTFQMNFPNIQKGTKQKRKKINMKMFGIPKAGKARTTFAPISDLWSRTASELMTGKIAHSPSLKVARKFWEQTGGEQIPTAEQLAMKPRKPQRPFKAPRIPKPKEFRKPKGMAHVMQGFKLR